MVNGAIIVIDDDRDYSCLLELALQEAQVRNPIELIEDGLAAVDLLRQHVELAASGNESTLPALVLLDLRMPRISGIEILRWIRTQPLLARIPVVLMTGIRDDEEQSRALSLGAASLCVKPFSYGDLLHEAAAMRDRYLLRPELLKDAA